MANLGSFPRVTLPGLEVNHSPLSTAEVKNEWSYTSASLYAFMALSAAAVALPLSRIALCLS
jgi:hypothetical protein